MEPLFEDEHKTFFAELILPVPIPKLFTYRIPSALGDLAKIGQRAIVQFGKKKILTGIIAQLHEIPPKDYEAKYILDLLDDQEIVYSQQFTLYEWMADYYMCSLGEVVNAAIPSGLKLSSESRVQLNPSFSLDESTLEFSERETMLIQRLQTESMDYSEVSHFLGIKNLYSILKSLSAKEAIILFEAVKEKYKPKTEKRIRLSDNYVSKIELEQLFEQLSKNRKQEAILLKYLQDVAVFSQPQLNENGISKTVFKESGFSISSLNTLIKNNILEEFEVIVPRFQFHAETLTHPPLLSELQENARNNILKYFEKDNVLLFHGVTGSGKTEIYIDLIKRAIDGGTQALYLLPEIAITTQIVSRLQKIFGNEMGVYHSKFSDNERVEVWNGVLNGKYKFVVGVRSSIFLPFDNLGLIVVDEEHDPSYKQQEPAPRYHARDVALMMGKIHHAKVLLGSATPSVESFYHAQQNKYGFEKLNERFGTAVLPEIAFANIAEERKRKINKGEFTSLLIEELQSALATQEQAIIFQNRRGYSPIIQCEDCGWIPKCMNCSVSLTYHQYRNAIVCHYCGYHESMPKSCPDCSSNRIKTMGTGTQKLEEELKLLFPDSVIQRMDWDTTRIKTGYETIIDEFESGNTDILVGTQMVTKGLDFDRVSLVGVFDADRMMHFPDFRSFERAFQLMLQVSGRAGRREKKGKVIIQTSSPDHPLFDFVIHHNVSGFIEEQLIDREERLYPPYSRLIEVIIKHADPKTCREAATKFYDLICNDLGTCKIHGPAEPLISKIRNEYLRTILIKIPRNQGKLSLVKNMLREKSDLLLQEKASRNIKIVFDVDPV